MTALLDIRGLTIDIARDTGPARVVDGIEDERIPLDQRRVVLSNLSGALSECGERVRVVSVEGSFVKVTKA